MNIQSVTSLGAAPPERSMSNTTAGTPTAPLKTQAAAVEKTAQQPVQTEKTTKPSEDQLKDLVKQANDLIKPLNGSLQFSIDKDSGTTVVKVIDTSTKEVIKQFPSEEMLGLAKALDQLKGLLVKQQA